jgi:hypothetical protein
MGKTLQTSDDDDSYGKQEKVYLKIIFKICVKLRTLRTFHYKKSHKWRWRKKIDIVQKKLLLCKFAKHRLCKYWRSIMSKDCFFFAWSREKTDE